MELKTGFSLMRQTDRNKTNFHLNKKITVTMAASKKATVAAEPIIMYTSEIEKKTHYYITILIEY
jgi:hypothetical protein